MITVTVREHVFNECNSGKNAFGPAFFEQHLSVVAEYAKRLSEALGADLEIVELAAWLHDVAAVQDVAALPRHPALSAEIARKMLREKGYPFEGAERVAACIASHSAPVQIGNGRPEEVCVSNAGAMSQIVRPAWFRGGQGLAAAASREQLGGVDPAGPGNHRKGIPPGRRVPAVIADAPTVKAPNVPALQQSGRTVPDAQAGL
jgi:putative nucleotidyltransferase with HDIG domain